MKTIKRILLLLIAAALCSCGSEDETGNNANQSENPAGQPANSPCKAPEDKFAAQEAETNRAYAAFQSAYSDSVAKSNEITQLKADSITQWDNMILGEGLDAILADNALRDIWLNYLATDEAQVLLTNLSDITATADLLLGFVGTQPASATMTQVKNAAAAFKNTVTVALPAARSAYAVAAPKVQPLRVISSNAAAELLRCENELAECRAGEQ